MHPVISDNLAKQAADHLRGDPVLAPLIERFGPCPLRPHRNYYRELVESIIGQQLSIKAAASINRRFLELFEGEFPDAATLLNQPVEYLRDTGFSGAKVRYVQDLAAHVQDGRLQFDQFETMSNEDIIAALLPVKGIGEWTAHMFLMFCMARPDVLPVGDLGIRNGIQKLYGLDHLPSPDDIRKIAVRGNWHPFETIASWYVWQSLDNARAL